MTSIMIDLETLDSVASAVIVSIGLVAFDKTGIKETLYLTPSIQEQLSLGRTVKEDTLLWWMGQDDTARAVFQEPRISFEGTMKGVKFFIDSYPNCMVWGNGANFDPVILENALHSAKFAIPWKYWNVRCLRTFCDENEFRLPKKVSGTKHNALDDAKHQAEFMIKVWDKKELARTPRNTHVENI